MSGRSHHSKALQGHFQKPNVQTFKKSNYQKLPKDILKINISNFQTLFQDLCRNQAFKHSKAFQRHFQNKVQTVKPNNTLSQTLRRQFQNRTKQNFQNKQTLPDDSFNKNKLSKNRKLPGTFPNPNISTLYTNPLPNAPFRHFQEHKFQTSKASENDMSKIQASKHILKSFLNIGLPRFQKVSKHSLDIKL